MKKPAAPSRKPKIDKVRNLAAGLRRALQESGWSERGLSMAAGCKPDRLRNVGRGLSSTLPADVMARVADVLAVPAASLTGGEPWPAGGARLKRSGPPEEPKAAVLVPGSLAELAAEARRVAVEARAAVAVAVRAAEAAEHVAARAEAAAAGPPESTEDIFGRWSAEALAEAATRSVPLMPAKSPVPPAEPPPAANAPAPQVGPKAEQTSGAAEPYPKYPSSDVSGYAKRDRKRGRAPADPLEALIWFTKPYPHTVNLKAKQVSITKKIGKQKQLRDFVVMTVLKTGGFEVKEVESGAVVGVYDDAQIAAWVGLDRRDHLHSQAELRATYPAECEAIRARGGGDWAERIAARELHLAPKTPLLKVIAELIQCYRRLQQPAHYRGPCLPEEVVSSAAYEEETLDKEIMALLGGARITTMSARRAASDARHISRMLVEKVEALQDTGRDRAIGEALIAERLADRMDVLLAEGQEDSRKATKAEEAAKSAEASPKMARSRRKPPVAAT